MEIGYGIKKEIQKRMESFEPKIQKALDKFLDDKSFMIMLIDQMSSSIYSNVNSSISQLNNTMYEHINSGH